MYEELVKRLRRYHDNRKTSTIFSDAADAIENLQQTVAHYKGCADDWYTEACDYKAQIARWISVKERVPEEAVTHWMLPEPPKEG